LEDQKPPLQAEAHNYFQEIMGNELEIRRVRRAQQLLLL
jgi:hypothetical protein